MLSKSKVAFFWSAGLLTSQVRWPFTWLMGRLRLRFLELGPAASISLFSSFLGRVVPSQITVKLSMVFRVIHSRLTLHHADVLDNE